MYTTGSPPTPVLVQNKDFQLFSEQSEIRAISVNQWGSQLGLSVLNKLSQLYCSLVWESTVLLSLCTPNR